MTTITTAEELDALPHGSIVRGSLGQAYLVLDSGIYAAGNGSRLPAARLVLAAPLTVVYRPDRDLLAEAKAEALREAADAFDAPHPGRTWREEGTYAAAAAWLRNRADRIEGGDR